MTDCTTINDPEYRFCLIVSTSDYEIKDPLFHSFIDRTISIENQLYCMYQLNAQSYQWILEMLYGIALIAPLVLFATDNLGNSSVLFVIGVAVGYILHVTEKMLVFNDMLSQAVQQEAEQKVDKQAEEAVDNKVKDTVEDTVKDTVEDRVENKVEEKVEDEVEDTMEDKVENKVEEKVDEKIE